MSVSTSFATALPALQPEDAGARLLLFGVRQIGVNGLYDACVAHAFVTAFGKDFQRPLVLLRALMQEMSAISATPIQIAPWCCARMTGAEAALLDVIARVRTNPQSAAFLLADMLGVRDASGVLVTAHALSNAFADLALPLESDR
ncbi:MAG: hypothetical protein EOP62_19185 [Sphingomonadales bacterium]|nr:MAG: hypothetical protein EOP62_19185 [Sphingomonadales bacterium]